MEPITESKLNTDFSDNMETLPAKEQLSPRASDLNELSDEAVGYDAFDIKQKKISRNINKYIHSSYQTLKVL